MAEIASVLGKTKNAVCGQSFRQDAKEHAKRVTGSRDRKPPRADPRPRKPSRPRKPPQCVVERAKNMAPRAAGNAPTAPAPVIAALITPAVAALELASTASDGLTTAPAGKTIMELRASDCRYMTDTHLYCGLPASAGSYCAAHAALCSAPTKPQQWKVPPERTLVDREAADLIRSVVRAAAA